MSNPLELSEVIQALRENLTEAQTQGSGQNIRFNVNSVDIELQTVVEKETTAGAKVRFLVIADAEANAKYKNSTTHKIKISLQAVQIDPANNQPRNLQLNDEE